MNHHSVQTQRDGNATVYGYTGLQIVLKNTVGDPALKEAAMKVSVPNDITHTGKNEVCYLAFDSGDGYRILLMVELEQNEDLQNGTGP